MSDIKKQPIIRHKEIGSTYRITSVATMDVYVQGKVVRTELMYRTKWLRPDGKWSSTISYVSAAAVQSGDWEIVS